jgi:hypothetical protein
MTGVSAGRHNTRLVFKCDAGAVSSSGSNGLAVGILLRGALLLSES